MKNIKNNLNWDIQHIEGKIWSRGDISGGVIGRIGASVENEIVIVDYMYDVCDQVDVELGVINDQP